MGAVTDESALEEIENIAKVFAYERRMKDYTPLFNAPYRTKKVDIVLEKKPMGNGKLIEGLTPRILVKGLS